MSKFKINDRVVVSDRCEYFKILRGRAGTVVQISEKTPVSMEMVDVKLDNYTKLNSIPFFPDELNLLKRV